MIEKVKTFTRIALGVVLVSIGLSCKKELEVKVPELTNQTPTILNLKNYMATLINANVKDIQYNETTESFSLFGVDQISKEQLTEFYNSAKK